MTNNVHDSVLIFSTETTEGVRDFSLMGGKVRAGLVSLDALEENIVEIGPTLERVVASLRRTALNSGLSEVTVAIGVNAKGKVGLLGTGSELGGSATITLKFSTK